MGKETSEFERVYKSFGRLYRSDLQLEAIRAVTAIENHLGKEEAIPFVSEITELFLYADSKISEKEKEFIAYVFKGSIYEVAILEAIYDEIELDVEAMEKKIDSLPLEIKDAVTLLGLCLIVGDREIEPEEKALFERIYR